MKYSFFLAFLSFQFFSAPGQTTTELISIVKSAQAKIRSASYRVSRQDTFVTGETRIGTGIVKIKAIPEDSIFGFAYWGKKDGINTETIYDGNSIFYINHDKQEYENTANPLAIEHSTGSPGGQMVVTDFIRLDTGNALSLSLTADDKNYYLIAQLPDITQYNVEKRIKTIVVDKQLLIPVGVRSRQETLGRVQDIYYTISEIKINDPSVAYDFSSERIPSGYVKKTNEPNRILLSLVGKQMPSFGISSFTNNKVSSDDFSNNVVLLDFWEVWCGPCLVSMPKVEALYEKYSPTGLKVYGMMSEKDQLDVAKLLVAKRNIGFPMLISDESLNKLFGIQAVPTYILIDRKGIIRFIKEGFSEELEKEIQKLL